MWVMSTLKIREEGRVLTEGFEGGTGWVRVSRVSRFLTAWHFLGKGPFRTFSSLTTRRVVRHKRFLSSRISLCIAIYHVHDREPIRIARLSSCR